MVPRFALIISLIATPIWAWEFTDIPVCTVSHETGEISLKMTFDHGSGVYALALARPVPWPAGQVFSIRFDGPRGLTISTDRQVISDNGRKLTASDQGFGNVLNGLEFNQTATPALGGPHLVDELVELMHFLHELHRRLEVEVLVAGEPVALAFRIQKIHFLCELS